MDKNASTRGSICEAHQSAEENDPPKHLTVLVVDTEDPKSKIPSSYRKRPHRLRPSLPEINYMILPNLLAYVMSWYGLLIGKFPVQVICITMGIGVMMTAGIIRIEIITLENRDFLPTDSRSIVEEEQKKDFDFLKKGMTFVRVNRTWTDEYRGELSRTKRQTGGPSADNKPSCRLTSVLVVAKHNHSDPTGRTYNLFQKEMMKEIQKLEDIIYGVTIKIRTSRNVTAWFKYDYPGNSSGSLCTKYSSGKCGGYHLKVAGNAFPQYKGKDAIDIIISDGPFALTWPRYMGHDFSSFFGKVETKNGIPNERVEFVQTIRQVFCLDDAHNDYFKKAAGVLRRWERKFDWTLRKYSNPYFHIYWMSEADKGEENDALTSTMLKPVIATFLAVALWCSVNGLMGDAVRSKPWVGIIGVFSTLFACAAGFGIKLWMEPKFQYTLMAVPLLTLAIGLDDMFILLEAWSSTNPKLPVEERMMLSMNIGGTSIVITFFINVLDFVIGEQTPFPVIIMLSEYAIATMTLDFFFQMTIFAPCVVLFGRLEEMNHHSVGCCVKVPTRESKIGTEDDDHMLVWCYGGFYEGNQVDSLEKELQGTIMENHDEDSDLVKLLIRGITSLPFQIFAIQLFFTYIGVMIWSITQIEVGLKVERIYPSSSNVYDYIQQHRLLFMGYGSEVTVIISNQIDYSDPKIQNDLDNIGDKLESSGYYWEGEEARIWWRGFRKWASEKNVSLSRLRSNADVIYQLQKYPDGFLNSRDPDTGDRYGDSTLYGGMVRINTKYTEIMKSRFVFRAKDMSTPDRQVELLRTTRDILKQVEPQIQAYAFTNDFHLYDQHDSIVPTIFHYCGITLGVTLIIAFLMIPHPACFLWVLIFVCSVLIGIVGLMRFWGMDLDSSTLITLLVAISFCTDLIIHPVYIFMIFQAVDKEGVRLTGREARLAKSRAVVREVLGASIPACVGTTLSVIAMSTSDSYIFVTFFRILFLSVILSILHGLIFVPTFLSIIGPSQSSLHRANDTGDKKQDDTVEPPKETYHSSFEEDDNENVKVRRRKRIRRRVKRVSMKEYEEPIYFSGKLSVRASRFRGALGAMPILIPNGNYQLENRRLPSTIQRVPTIYDAIGRKNNEPRRSSTMPNTSKTRTSAYNTIDRAETISGDSRLKKSIISEMPIRNYEQPDRPKARRRRHRRKSQELMSRLGPPEIGNVSERLRRWSPPVVVQEPPPLPERPIPSQEMPAHSSSGFVSSNKPNTSDSSQGNVAMAQQREAAKLLEMLNSTRNVANMLPARQKFNM